MGVEMEMEVSVSGCFSDLSGQATKRGLRVPHPNSRGGTNKAWIVSPKPQLARLRNQGSSASP